MSFSRTKRWLFAAAGATAMAAAAFGPASALDLKEAVQTAVDSNPQVNQAQQNREAIDFERRQAEGLWLPRVTLDASAGARRLENPTRRNLGLDDDTLYPLEAGVTAEQVLMDSGSRRAERDRQAARSDGAATRVGERAEFIALETAREYLNYLLQERIAAAAQDNIAFHERMVADLGEGVTQGSISVADRQQAEERLQSSKARLIEAREDLMNAIIQFGTRTGLALDGATLPPPLTGVPASVDEALGLARENNPRVKIAMADIDAAHAQVRSAKSELGPRLSLEGRARVGEDVDAFEGETTDLQARLVLRWTLFDGGIRSNAVQEQTRRASEERYRLHQVVREVEEDVRTAWTRREQQGRLLGELERQITVSNDLLTSYSEQFRVGRRSLLDVLDAQNTRYNSQVLSETARFAQLFAEYKLLASTGQLLDSLGIQRPKAAASDSRSRFEVPTTPPAEVMERRYPDPK